jgi:hypothetical protein
MIVESNPRSSGSYVRGPDGSVLTMDNLPSSDTARWVPRRKAEIVAAVRGGLLSLDEACERYSLTSEEYLTWQDGLGIFGLEGLRTTNRQCRRQRSARASQ